MTIRQNIAAKDAALSKLKAHCLCTRIDGDIVFLPEGYAVDGLRIVDTAECYIRAEAKLEEIWQASMFWKH